MSDCYQGGIGVSLSILWVIGHLYVLCHTSEYSLREQRSVSYSYDSLERVKSIDCHIAKYSETNI